MNLNYLPGINMNLAHFHLANTVALKLTKLYDTIYYLNSIATVILN